MISMIFIMIISIITCFTVVAVFMFMLLWTVPVIVFCCYCDSYLFFHRLLTTGVIIQIVSIQALMVRSQSCL